MKRLLIILILSATAFGCAALQQAKYDATQCLVDPICRAEAVREAEIAKGIAKDVSGVSPIPLSSNLIGGLVYGLFFTLALIKGGKKKQEDTQ